MATYALPALCAVFIWWFSTGLIVVLDHLPTSTFRWSMFAATLVAGYAFHVILAVGDDVSEHGAYAGFMAAIAIWGWQEMSFLMGLITGPSRNPCCPDCRGWRRFRHGVAVVAYHEIAIAIGGAAICLSSLDATNRTALWTYTLLWGMRVSAKLNLFAGVRNVSERFLPPHLAYLGGFFRQRPMNGLIPISLTLGTIVSMLCIQHAAAAETPFGSTSCSLLATMAVLGTVEHWFLIIPLPFEALWNWYLRARIEAPLAVPTPKLPAGASADPTTP